VVFIRNPIFAAICGFYPWAEFGVFKPKEQKRNHIRPSYSGHGGAVIVGSGFGGGRGCLSAPSSRAPCVVYTISKNEKIASTNSSRGQILQLAQSPENSGSRRT